MAVVNTSCIALYYEPKTGTITDQSDSFRQFEVAGWSIPLMAVGCRFVNIHVFSSNFVSRGQYVKIHGNKAKTADLAESWCVFSPGFTVPEVPFDL